MKKLLFILVLALLVSCNNEGDYQYVITMKDGTKVKAWSADSDGGGLDVVSPWGDNMRSYTLSSETYIRADYVGVKNINE